LSGRLVARVGTRGLMIGGILCVATAFLLLSGAGPGDDYARAILPGALVWGLGIGLAVTPLTAAVLAAVADADLGEASAINDAASRIGGLIAVAIVPALIGVAGSGFADALPDGFQPAMIVMAGLCAGGAVVTALFVSDERKGGPSLLPHPRTYACALPTPEPVATH
jgi:MFS family permease